MSKKLFIVTCTENTNKQNFCRAYKNEMGADRYKYTTVVCCF